MVVQTFLIGFLNCALGISACLAEESVRLPENPYALDGSLSCGPRCIAFLDEFFGGSSSYDDVLKKCSPGPFGTNLEQVRATLEAMDYVVVPFRAEIEVMKRIKFPAVIHLQREGTGGHFVVLLGWDKQKGTFRVFNPPAQLTDVDDQWIVERATGLGLIVSNSPLPPFEDLVSVAPARPFDWLLTFGLLAVAMVLIARQIASYKSRTGAVAGLLFLAFSLSGCSETGKSSKDSRNVQLGRVLEGTMIKHTFEVVNDAKEAIKINHVRKSCACQLVEADIGLNVQPGENFRVTVEVPTEGREGTYRQEFHVEATGQSGAAHNMLLSLTGNVESKIAAIPTRIMLGTLKSGEKSETSVTIKTNKPHLSEKFVSAEVMNNPDLSVDLIERTSGMLKFVVRLSDHSPSGDIFGSILFRFDDSEVPTVDVPIFGRRVGLLKTIPRALSVNDQSKRLKFRIQSENGAKFRIIDINCPSGSSIVGVMDEPNSSFDLELVLSELAPSSTSLRIETDLPEHSVLLVPINESK